MARWRCPLVVCEQQEAAMRGRPAVRQIVVAAVGAAVVASVAVTVLVNGVLFSATPASSEGQPSGEPEEMIQGDVDCDGDVDAVDALKGLRHVASLPVTQNDPCPDVGTTAAIPGPPGVSGYEIVLVESEPNSESFKSVTADCSSGKSIIGGGARVVISGGSVSFLSIIESRPVGANWKATAVEISGGTEVDWHLEVRAICVTLGD